MLNSPFQLDLYRFRMSSGTYDNDRCHSIQLEKLMENRKLFAEKYNKKKRKNKIKKDWKIEIVEIYYF